MPDFATEADYQRSRVLDFFLARDRGAFGGLSSQWMDAIVDDPLLASVVVCVDLVFGGDTFVRISTAPIVARTRDGLEIAYQPLLMEEPAFSRSFKPGDPQAEVESVQLQIASSLLQPKQIVAAGKMLAGFGEISLQIPGGAYEERHVLIRGEMTGGVTFGADEELVSLEISDLKITSDLLVPPWVASVERHPDLPEDWAGERYPIVFNGFPALEAIRLTTDVGWPTPPAPTWLACYGHAFTITSVYVNGEIKASGSTDYPWAEADSFDDVGTPYKQIAFVASATAWQENDAVNVTITADEQLHLITIVQRLVEQYCVLGVRGAHPSLFALARGLMPTTIVPKVVINGSNAADEAGILSFIESTLLASFPMVSMVWQDGRYGPIVTDIRGNPVAELDADTFPLVDRTSEYQECSKEDIFNTFMVRHSWDPISNTYAGVQIRDPSNDADCRVSRDLVGPRTFDTIESPFIHGDAQANYVIDWLVAHLSAPCYYVEWSALPFASLVLKRGDLVWYTDPEQDWTAERAIVVSVSRDPGGSTQIGLKVWPGRRRLHTGRTS